MRKNITPRVFTNILFIIQNKPCKQTKFFSNFNKKKRIHSIRDMRKFMAKNFYSKSFPLSVEFERYKRNT